MGYAKANDFLTAWPNRSIASVILSAAAAANVALKNMSVGTKFSRSAVNQLPFETKTPSSTDARKISSSMSASDLVAACGCFFHSTLSQSCHDFISKISGSRTKRFSREITYKHSGGWRVPADDFVR